MYLPPDIPVRQSRAEEVGWGRCRLVVEGTGTPLLPGQFRGQEIDITCCLSFPRSEHRTHRCFSALPFPVALRNLSSFEESEFLIQTPSSTCWP